MKRLLITAVMAAFVVSIHAQLPAVTLKTIDGQAIRTDTQIGRAHV